MLNNTLNKNLAVFSSVLIIFTSLISIDNDGLSPLPLNIGLLANTILFIIQIALFIYTVYLAVKLKGRARIKIAPHILMIHIIDMLLKGQDMFFVLSALCCTCVICIFIKNKFCC